MSSNKKVHIIGGGTFNYVRNHLALAAPAFGNTARKLHEKASACMPEMDIVLHLTRMAGGGYEAPVTNNDLIKLIQVLTGDPDTKIIFLSASVCDWNLAVSDDSNIDDFVSLSRSPGLNKPSLVAKRKYAKRLNTNAEYHKSLLVPASKIISSVKLYRKDIFLVGFKQTCGESEDETYIKGLRLCKDSLCDLVLANDIQTRLNMIVTPREEKLNVSKDRDAVLSCLIDMSFDLHKRKYLLGG